MFLYKIRYQIIFHLVKKKETKLIYQLKIMKFKKTIFLHKSQQEPHMVNKIPRIH